MEAEGWLFDSRQEQIHFSFYKRALFDGYRGLFAWGKAAEG
jgi:hypothetical protein